MSVTKFSLQLNFSLFNSWIQSSTVEIQPSTEFQRPNSVFNSWISVFNSWISVFNWISETKFSLQQLNFSLQQLNFSLQLNFKDQIQSSTVDFSLQQFFNWIWSVTKFSFQTKWCEWDERMKVKNIPSHVCYRIGDWFSLKIYNFLIDWIVGDQIQSLTVEFQSSTVEFSLQ
jgi:hypothetical protein